MEYYFDFLSKMTISYSDDSLWLFYSFRKKGYTICERLNCVLKIAVIFLRHKCENMV